MNGPIPLHVKKIILVEGDDDFHFLCNTMEYMGINDIHVIKIDGKTKLKKEIRLIKKQEVYGNIESLSVILDADDSIESTSTSIISTMQELDLSAPRSHGEVLISGNLKTSFFIMPGNGETGAIEDLIIRYAKKKKLNDEINSFFESLKDLENSSRGSDDEYTYPSNDKKSKVQVFLSCHFDSDTRIGTSIKKHIIDLNDPVFDEIKDFLRKI